MYRRKVRHVAVAVAATLMLAACSSSSKSVTPTTSPAATVSIRSTRLGNVLVNGAGRTLYLYDKDSAGTSKCTDPCTTVWPPLAASGTPTYGSGLRAAMFSTITRPDGTKQLAVNHLPLYTYSGDIKAGDTTGQDLGDFFAAGPNGTTIRPAS
jgi:predicted lipoprotein with Yx(FWY)xxD motif